MKKVVTLWYKVIRDENGKITSQPFNHLEFGWATSSIPAPKSETYTNQVAWKNDEWYKEVAYLNENNKVTHI